MLKHHKIEVQQELSYYTTGNIEDSNHIFLIFHGYAQNASDMYETIHDILPKNSFCIYFEGSSHFYKRGIKGDSVNSWMTSHNRSLQIDNYLIYIERVITSFELNNEKKITAIAFSQGVATLSRYIAKNNLSKINCIFIASPPATEYLKLPNKRTGDILLTGNSDPLLENIPLEKLKINIINYEGEHEIPKYLLKNEILKRL